MGSVILIEQTNDVGVLSTTRIGVRRLELGADTILRTVFLSFVQRSVSHIRNKSHMLQFPIAKHILRISTTTVLSLKPLHLPIKPIISSSRFLLLSTMSSMRARLAGKTILITGASSGIGRSTALEFARTSPEDLKLIITARRIEALHELAAEINRECGEGVKVLSVKLDVSDKEEVRRLFAGGLPGEFAEVDVLVNNACVPPFPLPVRLTHLLPLPLFF